MRGCRVMKGAYTKRRAQQLAKTARRYGAKIRIQKFNRKRHGKTFRSGIMKPPRYVLMHCGQKKHW